MATQIDVCNMALLHLGQVEGISNFQSDRTPAGIYLRTFYQNVFNRVLDDAPWPFATTVQPLALLGSSGTSGINAINYWQGSTISPTPIGVNADQTEWGYCYAYPSQCLTFRRILSFTRNDNRRSRVSYRIMNLNGQMTINTDLANAFGEWTMALSDVSLASDNFASAFSYLLAAEIAAGMTKGNMQMIAPLKNMYKEQIAIAKASAFNEEQPDMDPESSFISVRY